MNGNDQTEELRRIAGYEAQRQFNQLGAVMKRSLKMSRADCLRTLRVSAPCDVCGIRPEVAHIPLHIRGFFCERCCPLCGTRDGERTAALRKENQS